MKSYVNFHNDVTKKVDIVKERLVHEESVVRLDRTTVLIHNWNGAIQICLFVARGRGGIDL